MSNPMSYFYYKVIICQETNATLTTTTKKTGSQSVYEFQGQIEKERTLDQMRSVHMCVGGR